LTTPAKFNRIEPIPACANHTRADHKPERSRSMGYEEYPETVSDYDELNFGRRVAAIVPAAGYGFRSTPAWARRDPYLDTVAKPAMRDLFRDGTYLDIIFDTLIGDGVVSKILLFVGKRPPQRLEDCKDDREKYIFKIYKDLMEIGKRRYKEVLVFHSTPGSDFGSGAALVSDEGKRILGSMPGIDYVLVHYGDVPNIPSGKLKEMIIDHVRNGNSLTVVSTTVDDPFNYGRIVRYPLTALGIVDSPDWYGVLDEKSRELNRKVREGEIIMIEVPEVDIKRHGLWAKYLFIDRGEYDSHDDDEEITLYHPKRDCLERGYIKLSKREIERRRIYLEEGQSVIWHPRSGEFLDVKEQDEIGRTPEEREEIGSLRVWGIDYPISTDYIHSIKERNTGLRVFSVKGRKFSKEDLDSITECRKLEESPPGVCVLERHPNDEYYLPEIQEDIKARGGKIGLFTLPKGVVKGYDSRAEARLAAISLNSELISALRGRDVRVSDGTTFRIGQGFDPERIEPGVSLSGNIVLYGKIRIRAGTSLEDVEIANYYFNSYDSHERQISIRNGRRGRDELIIGGDGTEIRRSLIVNSVVGERAKLLDSEVVGVDVEPGMVIRNKIMRIGPDGLPANGKLPRGSPRLPLKGLVKLDDSRELRVIEEVYAATVWPWTEVFVDGEIADFLKSIYVIMNRSGGAKRFCDLYGGNLSRDDPGSIPGLEKFKGIRFYIGANATLSGTVALRGSIYINPWSVIYNSCLEDTSVGRNAHIWNSILRRCNVMSEPGNVTLIDGERLEDREIPPGYPHKA